ncbi:rRNA accumulation- protein [Dipsacomyces acuminosporus]|nr:rRNA accumulation- protein [Dipsacomyces acuminosporus]
MAAAVHPNKEAFIEGVDHIFAKWTALELAVQNGWGGRNSQEKRDSMVDEVVNYFDELISKKKKPEPSDIEELLLDIMDEDFNIMLEDNSAIEVAKDLCKVFVECIKGNFATVDKLRDERDALEAQGRGASAAQSSQAAARSSAEGADASDSSDDGESGDDSDTAMNEN